MTAAATAKPRTLAPPQTRRALVTGARELGSYVLIAAADAAGPPDPRPGQFYMLSTAARWGGPAGRPYLPRAFSFARARPGGGEGAELDFLLEDVGPGTRRLAELRQGGELVLLGPLGAGFGPPADGSRPLLVAGGIGVAPILALSDELGAGTPVLLGFRSEMHAAASGLFGSESLTVTTEDGSAGRRGLVTEPLAELLETGSPATVYACGPPAMLEAVRALCAERSVPAQLALESGMACGYGACFGCVVPTRAGFLRVCVDGPVLDADLLESALIPGTGH